MKASYIFVLLFDCSLPDFILLCPSGLKDHRISDDFGIPADILAVGANGRKFFYVESFAYANGLFDI